MLVDTGSSVDILYIITFDKLQLPRSIIQLLSTPLTGFTGHSINAMGVVPLDFTVGSGSKVTTIRAQFTVVDIEDQSYNGLIGRPILMALRAIVSPVHLKMKFPTPGGIGEISGDQNNAKRCYQTSVPPLNKRLGGLERKRAQENQMEVNSVKAEVDEVDNSPKERESEKRTMPYEDVVMILFKEGNNEQTFIIGSKLGE
ncbi:hypothetical protein LIER_21383 [Lithospermum erythrorhizon]|uniref:Peptidase A2 domain-containing protein n=1 Tax=Lithospermum erythrorhizon TaxID=34254 RepID=A0AAV3QQ23_LITER